MKNWLFHKLSPPLPRNPATPPFKIRFQLVINQNSTVSDEVLQSPGIAVDWEVSSEGGRRGND